MLNKKIKLILIVFLVLPNLLFAIPARPRDVVYNGVSNTTAIIILSIFIFLFLLIIVVYFIQKSKQKSDLIGLADTVFRVESKRFGLTREESSELRDIADVVYHKNPSVIFESITVFENSIQDKYEKLLKKHNKSAHKIEQELLFIESIREKLKFNNIINEQRLSSTRNIELKQLVSISRAEEDVSIISDAVVVEKNEAQLTIKYNPAKVHDNLAKYKDVTLKFTRIGDGFYKVILPVLFIDSVMSTIVLGHNTDMYRDQLRNNVRLTVQEELVCKVIRRSNKMGEVSVGGILNSPALIDVGGGGVAFVAKEELDVTDMVYLSFRLKHTNYKLQGEVVAIIPQKGIKGMRYKHRISFRNVEKADIERIIKYIFAKQREQVNYLTNS